MPARSISEPFKALARAKGEADVRDALHDALKVVGAGQFHLEYQLESGPVDMASEERRVLIETKARNQAGPTRPGSGSDETQKEQVERYLRDARVQWLGDLFASDGEPRAFLTDGLIWWGYEIGPKGRMHTVVPKTRTTSDEDLADFLEGHVCELKRRYKLPAPDDLVGELLDQFARSLDSIYRQREADASVQTKRALWKECLRGAGIVPSDDEPFGQASLFVRHSVLVLAARILKVLLRHDESPRARVILDAISDGFAAWVAESDEGKKLVREIARKLERYEWREQTKDRLKEAYHKLIQDNERKEFGEYYTPDWLAGKVVEETLDESWMDAVVTSKRRADSGGTPDEALTVLDPSCGSGTFLFHTAQRLLKHIRERHPGMLPRARTIISRSVVGIDVHPIAVEMAEATLEMALPPASMDEEPGELQVFLGDAMQSTIKDDLGGRAILTSSARGTQLALPIRLALHPDADVLIGRLVDAAIRRRKITFPEVHDKEDRADLDDMHAVLQKIIQEESDHVWKWHLRNLAAPIRLARQRAGRIVGNPPWLVSNDTPDGFRKERIAALRKEYGLLNKSLQRRGASSKGDLAAVFSARVTDLYLAPGGRMGLVLPGGALINQTWKPWRTGCWHGPSKIGRCHVNLERAWGLDDLDPPPFEHAPSGCCVVFAERLADEQTFDPKRTGLADADVGWWSGRLESGAVTVRRPYSHRPSEYEDEWDLGVLAKPHGLTYVLDDGFRALAGGQLAAITTKRSTKAPWSDLSLKAKVERRALLRMVRPQGLSPFQAKPDAYIIAPLVTSPTGELVLPSNINDPKFRNELPKTRIYWERAERIFQERRSAKAGATLLKNLDWKATLTHQLALFGTPRAAKRLTKVIYNESGRFELRASRCAGALIASGSLYWMVARSEAEALYIVGVVNAPCMQDAWRASKTSMNHFDKNPWRKVPVPRFDETNSTHKGVVEAARLAEREVGRHGRWDRDGGSAKLLSKAVASLLPDHAR